jgi:transposase InsO family protein
VRNPALVPQRAKRDAVLVAVRTATPDAKAVCPQDRVNRQVHAERPNQLWVSDFTCVSTWQGMVYVASWRGFRRLRLCSAIS